MPSLLGSPENVFRETVRNSELSSTWIGLSEHIERRRNRDHLPEINAVNLLVYNIMPMD